MIISGAVHQKSMDAMHPKGLRGKASIRRNVWGNWNGYIGRNRVWEIGRNDLDAQWWLEEQTKIQEGK